MIKLARELRRRVIFGEFAVRLGRMIWFITMKKVRLKKSLFGIRNIIYLIGLMKSSIGIWVIQVMSWNGCLFWDKRRWLSRGWIRTRWKFGMIEGVSSFLTREILGLVWRKFQVLIRYGMMRAILERCGCVKIEGKSIHIEWWPLSTSDVKKFLQEEIYLSSDV